MSDFTVVNHDTEQTFVESSRSDAEDRMDRGINDFDFSESDLEIVQGAVESYTDFTTGTESTDTATVESEAEPVEAPLPPEPTASDLPEDPSVAEDPIDWLPSHFVDNIQGVPAVNRKGYAVIASKYGVSVTAQPVTLPSETDFEYAEFEATATTKDGKTYTGFGSAHIDRMDGDDTHLLGELAETRAMKRATAWATGVGMTAVSELQNDL